MEWNNTYMLGEKGLTTSDLLSTIRDMFIGDFSPPKRTFYGINHILYGEGCKNLSQLRKAKMNASKTANILKEFQGWKPKVERKNNIQLWKIQRTRKKKSM